MSGWWASLRELGGLPRNCWILATASFINRCGTMVVSFLSLYYVRRLHFNLETSGWLVGCYSWGSLAAAPLAGALIGRYAAVPVLTASLLGAGVLMLCFPVLHGLGSLVVGGFVLGMVAEVARPATYTAIAHDAPPDRVREAFTLYRLAVNSGMSVGSVLGGWLASRSYDLLFWTDGLTSLLAAVGLLLMLRSRRPQEEPAVARPAARLSPAFPRFLFAHCLNMLLFVQIFVALPMHAGQVLGLPESQIGWLFAINTLLILLAEPWVTRATQGWQLTRALALGNLLEGSGLGLFALAPRTEVVALGVALFTAGEMLSASAGSAYLSRLAGGGRLLGRANAWYSGAGSLAFVLTPPLAGYSLQHFGYRPFWVAVALVGLGAAAAMHRLPEHPEAEG